MNRRTLLAGTGTTVTGILAGCTADSDSNSDENGAENGDENETENGDENGVESKNENTEDSEPSEEVRKEIENSLDAAYGHLETASNEFETETDIAFETEPKDPLSTSGIETALDNAESELDAIEKENASDKQVERLENGELAVSIFNDLLSATTELNDGFGAWDTADSYINNDRYNDAADQMETAAEHFREGESTIDTTRESWDELNSDYFKESEVELATTKDSLEHLEATFNAFARYSEATVDLCRGMVTFIEGSEYIEQERFVPAKNAFQDSSQSFREAKQQVKDAETAVPRAFRSEFIDATCESNALLEASGLMADGSEAAAAGNYDRARNHFDEASTALDTNCGNTV